MRKHLTAIFLSALAVLLAVFSLGACNHPEPERKIESATIDFTPKEAYARNEAIDLSGLTVKIRYDNGTEETVSSDDSRLSVSGTDTSATGSYTMTVSFLDTVRDFSYTVRDTRLTLVFGDGSYGGEKSMTVDTPENYTSVSAYLPTPDKEGYEFAGWFFDDRFTRPLTYHFNDRVDTSADLTLYAGYDVDYTDVFEYTVENGEVTLISFSPDHMDFFDLHIPSTIRLLPVVKIGDDFFENSGVMFSTYDTLSFDEDSALREIGKNAFSYATFENVSLPGTLVTVGESAFAGVAISEIHFPGTVRRIEKKAFEGCIHLQNATFGDGSVLEYIGEQAFALCSVLDHFVIPDSTITVSQEAFASCEVLSVVHVGRNVKSIGLHSFRGCSNLSKIEVDPDNMFFSTVSSDLYSKNGKELIRYCFGKNEREYTVPEGVTDIQESAFDAYNINPSLETITLPGTLVSIWAYAFRDCPVEFVIPASVKNIGSNAFSGNSLTEFRISAENKSFTVQDGILYTKDMHELIAVPNRTEKDVLILDRAVERVRSGAIMENKTLRFLVIPADSSLSYLEQGSIVPGSCKSLCGIYIEKAEPFTVAGDAMAGTGSVLYDKFLFYIRRENLAAYTEAWKNCVLTGSTALGEILLTERMVSEDTLGATVLDRIAAFLGIDTIDSEETLRAAIETYVENDINYYNFQFPFLFLDGVYRSGYDISSLTGYLRVFETVAIRTLTQMYKEYSDHEFGYSPSFYLLNRHYTALPREISDSLSDISEDIASLLTRTAEFYERQKNNIEEINAISSDMEHFDRDRALAAYREYLQYGWSICGNKWSDVINLFRAHCSVLIYDFLATDITPENLGVLRGFFRESFDENFNMEAGLDVYFRSYFVSETSRRSLYAYDRFCEKNESYHRLIDGINREMETFDIENFDMEKCRALLERYGFLEATETTEEARTMYSVVYAKYTFTLFLTAEVTEETYDDLLSVFAGLSRLIPEDELFDFCHATDAEIAAYKANKAALLRLFSEKNAALIELVQAIDADTFAEKIGDLIPLYHEAYAGGEMFMNLLTVEVTIGEETVTVTLGAACASLIRYAGIVAIVADFDAVTEDNYWDFFDRLYGADGIVGYQMQEDDREEVRLYFQNLALSTEEVLRFNDLYDQYLNFGF